MNYVTSDTELTGIADAIRAKTGGTEELTYPDEFVSEIGGLKSNAQVESVLSAIRNKYPENLMDPETLEATIEAGVTYTIGADVTYDGESHYFAMSVNLDYGDSSVYQAVCDPDSSTPAEGTVKHKVIMFVAQDDGIAELSPATGCTLSNVMMVVGSQDKEYRPTVYTFPGSYVGMVNGMTGEEATGVNF